MKHTATRAKEKRTGYAERTEKRRERERGRERVKYRNQKRLL